MTSSAALPPDAYGDPTGAEASIAPTQWLEPPSLHESIVFLARYLGTNAHVDRLREALSLHVGHPASVSPESLRAMLGDAGIDATRLPPRRHVKSTSLPVLVVGDGARSLAILSQHADGRYECALPGIEGSSWLTLADIAGEVPNAQWYAVRPRMYFDQRSLLYNLPQAARWFWDVFQRNRWIFYWALLGTVALNVFGALVPFYSMAVYDRVIPNNALGSLGVLTSGVALLIGFEFLMRLLRSHLLETAARRMDVALSARVFEQCLKMRASSRPASGGVLANTVRDFESVREFFATTTLTVLGDMPFMLLYLAVIALVGGKLAIVPLLCIPLLLGIALAARKPLAKRVSESMRESSQRTAHLFETMNGLDTVKSLGAEAWSRRKWEGLTQAIAENNLHTRELMARVNYGTAAVMAVANVAVVGVGAMMMADQALTMGQIIAVALLTGRALAPVSQIATLIVRWEQTRQSFDALDKIMASPTDEAAASLQAPRLSGRLEFREVSFAYPNQPPVLDRISMRIAPGERVGIIGKLGSGKSTVLKLLLNQYEPTAGSVLLDELVTTQLEPLSMRRQIGYVPQDVTLFHGTLRENIELGRTQASDEALLHAIRVSCLDEIVTQLPTGVATQVGERGERLSGGQRQTVAIARALLAAPRLLLLDEPSSMVDPATEQKLIERLRGLQDTTIVLVTHRMAMLALVDRLVVMDRGRIVADGPRDEVLRALSAQRQGDAAPLRAAPARTVVTQQATVQAPPPTDAATQQQRAASAVREAARPVAPPAQPPAGQLGGRVPGAMARADAAAPPAVGSLRGDAGAAAAGVAPNVVPLPQVGAPVTRVVRQGPSGFSAMPTSPGPRPVGGSARGEERA